MIESKRGLDNTVSEVWKKLVDSSSIHKYCATKIKKMLKNKVLPNDSLTSLVTSLTTILFRSVTVTSKFFHSRRLPRSKMPDYWQQRYYMQVLIKDICKSFTLQKVQLKKSICRQTLNSPHSKLKSKIVVKISHFTNKHDATFSLWCCRNFTVQGRRTWNQQYSLAFQSHEQR